MEVAIKQECCPIVCSKCGGENVQHAMWVYVNTNQVVQEFGTWNYDGSAWCDDCDDHTTLADKCD